MSDALALLCQRIDELEEKERSRVRSIIWWQHDDKIRALAEKKMLIYSFVEWLEKLDSKRAALKAEQLRGELRRIDIEIAALEKKKMDTDRENEEKLNADRQKVDEAVAATLHTIEKVMAKGAT